MGTCCGLTLHEEDQRQDGGSSSSSSEGHDWVEMRSRRGYGLVRVSHHGEGNHGDGRRNGKGSSCAEADGVSI